MKDTMNRLTILAAGTLAALGTWAADGVAVVRFDPNGGKLEDSIRVVRAGGTYGGTVNLYPRPRTVIRYLGFEGSSSIFWRSLLTYTMMAFSSIMVSPHMTL